MVAFCAKNGPYEAMPYLTPAHTIRRVIRLAALFGNWEEERRAKNISTPSSMSLPARLVKLRRSHLDVAHHDILWVASGIHTRRCCEKSSRHALKSPRRQTTGQTKADQRLKGRQL